MAVRVVMVGTWILKLVLTILRELQHSFPLYLSEVQGMSSLRLPSVFVQTLVLSRCDLRHDLMLA